LKYAKDYPNRFGDCFSHQPRSNGRGGDTTTSATTPPVTVAVPPTSPAAAGIGHVDFTSIDVSRLDNYANPVLPAYYDATVAALTTHQIIIR
jgi:hypothetical protein